MLGYLPVYYESSRVIRSLLQVQGAEFDRLRQALDETLDQFFVRTATWGLDRWEAELGLSQISDQPLAERRDRIVSRIRGTGTATISVVKAVAESYDRGRIDVVEDHAAYRVIVRFVDTSGIPPNLDDLKAAVRAVLPAHLDVNYELNYLIWSELDGLALIWTDLDDLGLTWDELEVFNPAAAITRASVGLTMSEQ